MTNRRELDRRFTGIARQGEIGIEVPHGMPDAEPASGSRHAAACPGYADNGADPCPGGGACSGRDPADA